MALLRLLVLLMPVCRVLPTDGDLHPPITNLRLDPHSKNLTWDLSGNVSSIKCHVNKGSFLMATNNRFCITRVLPKCQAWNYSVHVSRPGGEPFSAWITYPRQEGNPGAAAKGLQCRLHDVHFLTCSWAVGAEAPRDVQYDFYVEDLKTSTIWSCPEYTEGASGTHVQCQFADVSQFLADEGENNFYRFVVRGSSGESRVPCTEIFKFFSDIEELIAPKLTAVCNKSVAVLEWEMFSHFQKMFDYELEIQKDSDVPFKQSVNVPFRLDDLSKQSWILLNPGTFTVTIRAADGQWSAPQRFVCDHEDRARLHVWLIALATLLAVGALILLCKKYSVVQKLFPPIPHMKDPIRGNSVHQKMMAWEASMPTLEDCPVAEVQILNGT